MKIRLFALLLLANAAAIPASASLSYLFTVNTQALNTQSDNLDFQLNPSQAGAPAVSLLISNFSITGGSFDPTAITLTGGASGSLPSTLTLNNSQGYNDAYQAVTLGTSLSFLATLSGPGIDTPSSNGTAFAFSIYDNSGTVPLLTSSADGSIGGIYADNVNGVAPYTNTNASGGPSAATVTATPEPSVRIVLLVGFGAGLIALRRRA